MSKSRIEAPEARKFRPSLLAQNVPVSSSQLYDKLKVEADRVAQGGRQVPGHHHGLSLDLRQLESNANAVDRIFETSAIVDTSQDVDPGRHGQA